LVLKDLIHRVLAEDKTLNRNSVYAAVSRMRDQKKLFSDQGLMTLTRPAAS
jgi:hypothetical protein